MSRILTTSVAGLALMWSATAVAKDRPISDHEKSVTVAPLKLINPLVLVEYEQAIDDTSSFTVGAGYGNYNNILLRIVNALGSAADARITIRQIKGVASYNRYFKHFNRGWYWGAGLEYDRLTPSVTVGDEVDETGSAYSTIVAAPHIGWKVATEGGFTFSWDYGLGYRQGFGSDVDESVNGLGATGSMNMGWSF